jgi:hypothetical protein
MEYDTLNAEIEQDEHQEAEVVEKVAIPASLSLVLKGITTT